MAETVKCPLKGHYHEIELLPHPETPGKVVGYCGKRAVIEMDAPKPKTIRRSYSRKKEGD